MAGMKKKDTDELKISARSVILDLKQMKDFCEKPLIISEAKGIYLTDIEGKRYIDGISGIYSVNAGHGKLRWLRGRDETGFPVVFDPH